MILRDSNIKAALRRRQRGFLLNPYRFGGSGVPTDPYFANVVLLAHCNGADLSTAFTDNSPVARALTANGNAKISTAQSVFNGSSALLDGTGDYITAPNSADFNFPGDFTIEYRVRFASLSSPGVYQGIVSTYQGVSDVTKGFICALNNSKFIYQGSGDGVELTGVATLSANTWYAHAITRSGTTVRSFIDGTIDQTWENNPATSISSNTVLSIGRLGGGYDYGLNGHLAEIRITKGVARYTSNYSIATAPFPDS